MRSRLFATLSRVVIATLALMIAAATARASHITMRPDGSGDYPTLQAAVNAMTYGPAPDSMILEPGYYNETVNFADPRRRPAARRTLV